MKRLTLHQRTFEPSRIKYPMVRKGWDPEDPSPEGRGEDEFERVSWDEAIDLIAEKMATLEDEKRFHVFNAIKSDGLITRHGAGRRLASIFGGCEWTEYDWYADLPPGHVMTTGYQTSDADASAWRAADYTKQDGEICALVAEKLDEKLPPEERNVDSYRECFAEFLDEDGDVRNYIQEALDAGMTTRDIDVEDHEALEPVDRARPSYRSVT